MEVPKHQRSGIVPWSTPEGFVNPVPESRRDARAAKSSLAKRAQPTLAQSREAALQPTKAEAHASRNRWLLVLAVIGGIIWVGGDVLDSIDVGGWIEDRAADVADRISEELENSD